MRGVVSVLWVVCFTWSVGCTTTQQNRTKFGLVVTQKSPHMKQKQRANARAPFAHAVLLNGGQKPEANFFSHLTHLKEMRKTLRRRELSDKQITIFASDGTSKQPDLLVLDAIPSELLWLFRYRPERAFFEPIPRLINSTIKGKTLHASTKWSLSDFFSVLSKSLPSGATSSPKKPVFLFVTDHGERNRTWRNQRNQRISLWKESLNVWQFHQMLRPLRKRRVVYVMSQCFSGSFAWSVFPRPGFLEAPDGNRCGFFSTLAHRYAYGCYPETQKKRSIGHAHRFIQAMKRAKTLNEAHERVLLTDQTPDVPLRSSDHYLHAVLEEAAKRKRQKLPDFADAILQRYAAKGAAHIAREQELIDALARRFDIQRPSNLKSVLKHIRVARKEIRFRRYIAKVWKKSYRTLRDDYLEQFYKKNPTAKKEIKQMYDQLMQDPNLQRGLRNKSSVQRMLKGFRAILKTEPSLSSRIQTLHDHITSAHRIRFWVEVQEAVLRRMIVLYYRMAGVLFLRFGKKGLHIMYREGFERLLSCESTQLGTPKHPLPSASSLPILKKKMQSSVPWFLGIQYQPIHSRRSALVPAGSIRVRHVGVGSPAEQAGVRAGDYVTGSGGKAFRASYELRERTMLQPVGQPMRLDVVRGSKKLRLSVRLRRMKSPQFVRFRPLVGTTLHSVEGLTSLKKQLPDLTKGTTLLFFWATWCGPCKLALPILRTWEKRYRKKGLHIVAVSRENKQRVKAWYAKNPSAMPFVRTVDTKGSFSAQLRVFVVPTFIVVRDGKILLLHKGARDFKRIENALKQSFGAAKS